MRTLQGLGAKSEERILEALAKGFGPEPERRGLLGVGLPVVREIVAALREHPAAVEVSEAGSTRRGRETFRDLDVIATATSPARSSTTSSAPVGARDRREGRHEGDGRHRSRASASTSASCRPRASAACCSTSPARRTTTWRSGRTRSGAASRSRSTASRSSRPARSHRFPDEEELYRFLGYESIPPELRENGGELDAARDGGLPRPRRGLATSSASSTATRRGRRTGRATIEEMARAARGARLPVPRADRPLALPPRGAAGGPVAGDRGGQRARQAVPRAPRDRGEHPRRRVARRRRRDPRPSSTGSSPRSTPAFDRSPTERILAAIDHPHVDCIGHLTGRKLNRRPGADIDVEQVSRARSRRARRSRSTASPTGSTCATSRAARRRGGRARPDHDATRTRRRARLRGARRRAGAPRVADEGAGPQHAPVARDREAPQSDALPRRRRARRSSGRRATSSACASCPSSRGSSRARSAPRSPRRRPRPASRSRPCSATSTTCCCPG